MKLVLSGEQFSEIFSSLAQIRSDCFLTVTATGLNACSVDSGNAILADLTLSPRYFKEFEQSEEFCEPFDVGYITKLRIKKDGTVTIWTEPDMNGAWLVISTGPKTFRIHSLYPHPQGLMKTAHAPSLDYSHAFTVERDWFAEAVADVSQFADRFILEYADQVLIARSPLDDEKMYRISLPHELTRGSKDETARSKFSIDYIKAICRIVSRYRKISVSLGTDYPIKVGASFLGQDPDSSLSLWLAPRIEDGDDE